MNGWTFNYFNYFSIIIFLFNIYSYLYNIIKRYKEMKTTYFKFIAQKTVEGKTILVAVIPDDMLGKDLPSIYEGQAFLMPATIYTGTYPQIKINTDTIIDKTEEFKGLGISGIITEAEWYIKNDVKQDVMGISLETADTEEGAQDQAMIERAQQSNDYDRMVDQEHLSL